MAKSALVLGAGGASGAGWLAGILAGLKDAGLSSLDFDLVMGTSSGAPTAAYITAGLPLDALHHWLIAEAAAFQELGKPQGPDASVSEVTEVLLGAVEGATEPREIRRRVGQLAVNARTMPEEEFCKSVAASLPIDTWPDQRFAAVAVNVESGDARLFDKASGVAMVSAVAAACAIPVLCPPVYLGGSRYIDAGLRSNENLDLATGFESILVMSPRGLLCPQAFGGTTLEEDVRAMRGRGVRVEVIEPEGHMLDLICEHMLDQTAPVEIGTAGREQGQRMAELCASVAAKA